MNPTDAELRTLAEAALANPEYPDMDIAAETVLSLLDRIAAMEKVCEAAATFNTKVHYTPPWEQAAEAWAEIILPLCKSVADLASLSGETK